MSPRHAAHPPETPSSRAYPRTNHDFRNRLYTEAHGRGLAGAVGICPLQAGSRTEALVTDQSEGIDDLAAVPRKATTTVAIDFGRITLADDLVLYLFGTPGQRRFWFMWDDLCVGAIGAIVIVDTDRLDEAFSPLDYFEQKGLPFIVAVNQFEGAGEYPLDAVAAALALAPGVPIVRIDARRRESVKQALVRVTEYSLERHRGCQRLRALILTAIGRNSTGPETFQQVLFRVPLRPLLPRRNVTFVTGHEAFRV